MKIAFITTDAREDLKDYSNPTPYFGTAPEALLKGFAEFPELQVHVVSCTRQRMTSPETLADNTWFHSLHVPTNGWLRTCYQGCIRAVRRKLRQLGPDIAHGQGTELDCGMDAVFSGFPNVLTIHGNMQELARISKARLGSYLWCAARLESLVLKRTSGVFSNSRHTQELVSGRARRTWLVPNPVREAFFAPLPSVQNGGACVLVHVGVVCENKQQLEMLRLARSLHQGGCVFELHFIGRVDSATKYGRAFLEQMNQAELEGYARYFGQESSEQLTAHFDRATALVHTSREEAFGLVVAEALARNLKVFAFRVGGIAEIAQSDPEAVLLAPNDWSALGFALKSWVVAGCPRLVSTFDLMRKRYSPRAVASCHIEIYQEVLDSVGRRCARNNPQK